MLKCLIDCGVDFNQFHHFYQIGQHNPIARKIILLHTEADALSENQTINLLRLLKDQGHVNFRNLFETRDGPYTCNITNTIRVLSLDIWKVLLEGGVGLRVHPYLQPDPKSLEYFHFSKFVQLAHAAGKPDLVRLFISAGFPVVPNSSAPDLKKIYAQELEAVKKTNSSKEETKTMEE